VIPGINVSRQYFGSFDVAQNLPLRIDSSEMFDDHGGQCFFKVFGPMCFVTVKYTRIADSVPTVNAHYKYPSLSSAPLEADLTGRFSNDFRHSY
jgi:hypothetical protein